MSVLGSISQTSINAKGKISCLVNQLTTESILRLACRGLACHGDGTKHFSVLNSEEEMTATLFEPTDYERALFRVK